MISPGLLISPYATSLYPSNRITCCVLHPRLAIAALHLVSRAFRGLPLIDPLCSTRRYEMRSMLKVVMAYMSRTTGDVQRPHERAADVHLTTTPTAQSFQHVHIMSKSMRLMLLAGYRLPMKAESWLIISSFGATGLWVDCFGRAATQMRRDLNLSFAEPTSTPD